MHSERVQDSYAAPEAGDDARISSYAQHIQKLEDEEASC
jgi:hypothetical protein